MLNCNFYPVPRTCCDFQSFNFSRVYKLYSVNANSLPISPGTRVIYLFLRDIRRAFCLYNYHWVYFKTVLDRRIGAEVGRRGLYTEIENYPARGRDSLKQFRNFPKPFLSALIKFVQSKPIIYENKTIWKRWCSNTLSLSLRSAFVPPAHSVAAHLAANSR